MKKVKWLHISDLHLNKVGVETRRMRNKLMEYLRENKISCEYIFITGDLRYAPAGTFDDSTVTFLNTLCSTVSVPIERLFIVPGNHDLIRDDSHRLSAIDNTCGNNGYYNYTDGMIKKEDLDLMSSGRDEFKKIIQEIYQRIPNRIALYNNSAKPHFCIETEDFNLVHLDSALTYTKNRQRDLLIGTDLLMSVLEGVNQNKATIILTHYSFDFLDRREQNTVFNLLTDYNVQMWFSGHEHNELLRMQRDYFYEFQCGNLMHEGDGTKSCVILGEYDKETFCGVAQVYVWNSPDGWSVYPFASRQKDRSSYIFELQNDDAKRQQLKNIASSTICKEISDEVKIVNLYDLNEDILGSLSNEQYKEIKNQMGLRLKGNESRLEVEKMFLNEVQMSLNSKKRYDCLPLFESVIRDTYKSFIYLDNNLAPVTEAQVLHFYFDNEDCFQIYNDSLQLTLSTINKEVVYISFGYQLGHYKDVDERLYRFETIRKCIESHYMHVKMIGHEEYNLSFNIPVSLESWKENIEKTHYWIDQMQRISKIEKYYGIKFVLPERADDEELFAVEVIGDSIENKSCRTLQPLLMKHPGFKKKFSLKNEIYIGNGVELPMLHMFGYSFRPVAEYILSGDYNWDKKEKGWKATNSVDGIPIRVEFEICFDDDRNRKLIQHIPYEDVQNELDEKNIVLLEGESAQFFNIYIRVTHDVQEIWQLFLSYNEQVEKFIGFDSVDRISGKSQQQTGKIIDKITANELTNAIVYTGNTLIKHIDNFISYIDIENKPDYFSAKWTSDNLGYAWMNVMRQYAINGHFPISVDNTGYCYYDMLAIEYEINQTNDSQLKEIIKLTRESFQEYYPDVRKIEHYSLLRNFMYVIAIIHKTYYEFIESYLNLIAKKMNEVIFNNPELIISSGTFEDHVVYKIDGEDIMHAFRKDSDIMMDFYKFKQHAEKHYVLNTSCMLQDT